MSNDDAAVRQLLQAWKDAVDAKDVKRIQSLVTEDSVFLVTGAPPTRGIEAVGKLMEASLAKMEVRQDFQLEEIIFTGEYAIGWGIESAEVTPLGSETSTRLSGYSMTILRRQPDGSWKFARGLNGMKPEAK